MCSALIGLHAFTGCDATSASSGRGKKSGYNYVMTDSAVKQRAIDVLGLLGQDFVLASAVCQELEAFTCWKISTLSIDEVCYQLFSSRLLSSRQVPPTQDALRQHMLRANNQCSIWLRALEGTPSVPSPQGFGWKIEDSFIKIHWMVKLPATQA